MTDYVKPSVRRMPDHFILHVGTNDLVSNIPPNEIASKVVDLAKQLKSENSDVSVSEIILRTDKPDLSKKGKEVNTHLKEMCKEKNIFLLEHSRKIKANHLNNSKLHLNRRGTKVLNNSFMQHIPKVFN